MGSRSRRAKQRRAQVKDITVTPEINHTATADRYQKYLPEWMRGNGAAAVRPPRPAGARRYRPQRRGAGGYTPGKFAGDNPLG